ncbi:hypothetical protein [Oligoflexus tunisiensis]|uniref:hypothetical protein n=1 Tax=Oligoflexus tunisiensis TaxID=708132 RepID=UPI00114CA43A|nr:hypothetical protein [Oligoflexus tunisiensis]
MMRISQLMSVFSSVGLLSSAAYGSLRMEPGPEAEGPACVVTGTSSLWQDGKGGWTGASRMEWQDCADGNNYLAACIHRGSGENMESCACFINNSWVYDRSCEGMNLTADLGEASRICCGYFEL